MQDVKRPDVAALMKKLAYKQAEANRTFGVLRKMFNLAEDSSSPPAAPKSPHWNGAGLI